MSYILAAIIGTVLLISLAAVLIRYFRLWLMALATGTHIGFIPLILMSLRKVDPEIIVRCRIMAAQAGLPPIPTHELESHSLAGGDIHQVTRALIAANCSGIHLSWNIASAVDLAGRNILEAVQLSVNPRVIFCPDPNAGRGVTLDGVAKDGVQLKVRVRVTVRSNLSQLVGGATELTVIARIGEGIISAIGSCSSYKDALSDPQLITRQVLRNGLDSQTSFAIVSIDIADIDVGENIGAKLQLEQASANIRIARSNAEKRRAMAVAREQEMIALTSESAAELVRAESLIPSAIAAAFRAGQFRGRKLTS